MITILIIVLTTIVSIAAFKRREIFYRYMFSPYQVVHRKQWYRVITHAFIHANWEHLIVNMIVLFSFGLALSQYFYVHFGANVVALYLGVYVGGIIVSSLYSLIKYKDDANYSAVGASGAISAVTFACILFEPMAKIYIFGLIPIPGVIFGALYLGYSYYMSKNAKDNVGHDAHFWGAVYGFIFPILAKPALFQRFFEQIF